MTDEEVQVDAVTLVAEYRHACEEWGATMEEAWLDRLMALEDRLLALLPNDRAARSRE